MPEICRFYGIAIRMFFDDHNPPHFDAWYSGQESVVDIQTLAAISGGLPPRAHGMVVEWASLHRDELLELWDKAKNLEPLAKIDPLP